MASIIDSNFRKWDTRHRRASRPARRAVSSKTPMAADPRTPPPEPSGGVSEASARPSRIKPASAPPLWLEPLHPGMRVAVAVSGGVDSVALLRALHAIRPASGLVLSVAHMHHGIRATDADLDAAFVESLAHTLGLPLNLRNADTPDHARRHSMGLEEAARTLRYAWFAELLSSGAVDAIATAHTLNDQAETVLHKLIRGAWTEGLSGIHPVLHPGPPKPSALIPGTGLILRPLLAATREQIVTWLNSIGQPWREDASNADLAYTRNRIRHQLLPQLATFNPQIAHQLSHTATIARDEESYWQKEVDRILPGLLLPGRAVRGGGRSSSTLPGERSLAIELDRLRTLHPALVRRLLRAAARQLGPALDFDQTARLLALAVSQSSPRREDLSAHLRAERTPRELRLLFTANSAPPRPPHIEIPVPGEGEGFGHHIRLSLTTESADPQPPAILRAALPSDRVQLRHSRATPKRIKEVLERLGIPPDQRANWPVIVWQGEIVWMQGTVLEPTTASHPLVVEAHPLKSA